MTRLLRQESLWLFTLWGLLFAGFYALNSGITCTNDGSHFALIKSLWESGSAKLYENAVFAGHDSAQFEGQVYSDRHPGLAFITVAFLNLMRPAMPYLADLVADPWSAPYLAGSAKLLAAVMLLPPLAGALLWLALTGILRQTGVKIGLATILALILNSSVEDVFQSQQVDTKRLFWGCFSTKMELRHSSENRPQRRATVGLCGSTKTANRGI